MTKRIFAIILCALTVAGFCASLCPVARADGGERVTVVLDPGHGGTGSYAPETK